jgi:hypothetical protein
MEHVLNLEDFIRAKGIHFSSSGESPASFSNIDVVLELDADYLAEAIQAGPPPDPTIPSAEKAPAQNEQEGAEDAGSPIACRYYLVNHKDRTILWLDDFHHEWLPVWGQVMGVSEMAHLRQSLFLSI